MNKKTIYILFVLTLVFCSIFSCYKFLSTKNTTVKIFMTFYKPFQLPPKGSILTPIQVGRASESEIFLGGKLSRDDIDWLHDNMIGDNIGDNISDKNRMFDVLTAYYYVWKHYKEIGNPSYIGFMAHRKILITNPNKYRTFNRSAPNYGYSEEKLLPLLKKHRVITSHTYSYDVIDDAIIYQSVFEHYITHHKIDDIEEMIRIIKLKYPEMIDTMNDVLYSPHNKYAVWNFWIMEKELAFDYFEKLFTIAFEIEKTRGKKIAQYDVTQKRAIGYLAERFYAIWLEYKMRTEKILPLFVVTQYL